MQIGIIGAGRVGCSMGKYLVEHGAENVCTMLHKILSHGTAHTPRAYDSYLHATTFFTM